VGVATGFEFDPYSREAMEDPYPVYRELLAHAPLYHNATRGFFAVSRYADLQACARDWEAFSSRDGVDLSGSVGLAGPGGFLDMDPPRHDELRKIVRDRFTPKAVQVLEQAARADVELITSRILARGGGDVAQELARMLPLAIVCRLLGFPERDHEQLASWFDAMVRRPPGTMAIPASAQTAATRMRGYVEDAVRRAEREADTVLAAMVAAERRGDLHRQELTGICVLLFLAGISTAAGLISTSLYLLAMHEDQRAALLGDPGLVPAAVDELLRFVSPVQTLARVTTRPVEIHGETLPERARLLLVFGAANRDPRRFERPNCLDVTRTPQRNVGFGEGIHFCLGAHLARLQTRVVLETILSRMPRYRICGPVRWMSTPGDRGLDSLPIVP
jgi:cytochrome P450